MSIIDFVLLLLVAGICGALGRAIAGQTRGGFALSVAVGFIGAVVGMWLAREMNLPELYVVKIGREFFPIVWTLIGATLFSVVISLLARR